MKKLLFLLLFPFSSFAQNQDKIPKCMDKLSETCNESFCITYEEKLCWIDDYLQKAFPTLNLKVAEFKVMDRTSGEFSVSQNKIPWGAYYFPYKNGGINQRWQVSSVKNHIIESDKTLNIESLKKLSTNQLNNLSPALKMDLFLNDPLFNFSKMELARRSSNRAKELTKTGIIVSESNGGFCNGARAAGVLWSEPTNPILVKRPNLGIQPFIFYPTDLKAILSASFFHPQHANFFGSNAISEGKNYNENCGIDPATFDVILRLMIKKLNFPFYIDADRTSNIDNKTVLKYNRSIKKIENLPNNEQKFTIEVILMTLAEFGPSEANKETKSLIHKTVINTKLNEIPVQLINNTSNPNFQFYRYKYDLIVNSLNKIVSGNWNTEAGFTKPNFAWVAWGVGNDDCSFYDNLESAGNPKLSFEKVMDLIKAK